MKTKTKKQWKPRDYAARALYSGLFKPKSFKNRKKEAKNSWKIAEKLAVDL